MANTIPANNNTGLYIGTGTSIPVNANVSANNISASGNVTVGGYIIANGSITTNSNFVGNLVGNVTGNITLSGGNTEVIYNDSGVTGSSPAFTFNESSNVLSVIGNISGSYIFGNGSQLTGITAGTNYSNANVAAYLPTFSGNLGNVNIVNASGNVNGGNLVSAGNVSGSYIFGNGSQLTGLPATYGNANVAAFLPTYSGNLTANVISTTGNIVSAANLVTSGANGNIVGANYVSANFYLGDGGLLTNVTATTTYANSNVASFLAAFGSNTISTTGTVNSGNVTGTNLFTAGVVSATGNVTGNYILGNGSQLTGIAASYGNANVATFLAAFGSNTVSTTGTITSGNITGSNILTGGVVSATGNVTAGNVSATGQVAGANLKATTNLVVGNPLSDNSTVTSLGLVTVNGLPSYSANVYPGVVSVANIDGSSYMGANISATGNVIGGNVLTGGIISATGNITTAGYFLGNFQGNISGNIVVPGANTQVLYNNDGNAGASAGLTFNSATNALATTGTVSATGNITGANLLSAGIISSTGNIFTAGNANVDGGALRTTAATAFVFNTTATTVTIGNAATTALNLGSTAGNTNVRGNVTIGSANTNSAVSGNLLSINTTTVNITGVANVGANGLNINSGGNIVISSGNLTIGGANGAAYIKTVSATGYVFNTANTVVLGNISANVGNVTTGANISAVGSVTGGNLLTAGVVSATGNVTGNYILGNGSQLTGLPATYSDANVNTLLAAWGSNTLSTTGNVSVGNLNMSGQVFDASGVLQLNAVGNIVLAPTSSTLAYGDFIGNSNVSGANLLTTGTVSATGKITAGAVAYANTDGTNGQVLTTYGNGQTYFSTVSGGGGSPGGANTQIQFNDGSAFAGNSNMTFDKTSGNITLGNVVYNALNVIPGNTWPNVANITVTSNVVSNPTRMVLGTGYFGNLSSQYNQFSQTANTGGGVGARLLVSDAVNLTGSNTRIAGITLNNWHVLTANIASSSQQSYQGIQSLNMIGGGPSGNTSAITSTIAYTGILSSIQVGGGTATTLAASVGNTTIGAATAINGTVTINPYSNVTTAIMFRAAPNYGFANVSGTLVYGNANNMVGYTTAMTGTSQDANVVQSGNVAHYYVPASSASFVPVINTGNIPRMATNYFAFRNDDDLAQVKLGRLSSFNELRYTSATTSGSLTIDKSNGQVQEVVLTGAVTSVAFSNFVTQIQRPNASFVQTTDTVTIIFRQGSTGYAVTMPTGTAYKYAGGVNTVGTTANAVTMISVTGVYDSAGSADQYLITISPEFT
jgi:filamentous hemagglutinin